jgi:hypothetical protein
MMSESGNRHSRLRNRRGAMMVFLAVSMVGMLGMLALTLDIGAGNRQRRIAQTAADAGAVGGATQIYRGMDSATVVAAAFNSATRNGFVTGNVTVSYPPVTGTYAGNDDYVEVVIAKNIPTIFGGIFNKTSIDIQARGVAGLTNSDYCVYALGDEGKSIDIPGDLTTNCGVIANGDIDVKEAKDFWAPVIGAGGIVDPPPDGGIVYEGVPPIPDPLAYLTVPPETVCDFTDMHVTANATLDAGVYCGGITIDKNIRATLTPGTYILRGGGLTGGEISATEATIINTNGPGNDVSAFRPITFGESCFVGLTAPTSGLYKGIVIFQDPAGPADLVNSICGTGPGDPDIVGTLYFPTQTLNLGNSNGKFVIVGSIIAKTITGTNGGADYEVRSPTDGSGAVKQPSLVQ